ncbi:MAG: hemoglobin/transferrin/lactoferrin receptor protein [Planctomycetota bacterium]|jgi:hemoglobin/transferrin/lactoferrin receptor protein
MLPLLLLLLPQDFEFEETVITAPRAARTVTSTTAKSVVVTGDELRATGERSLPRALSEAAGVWVQETNFGGGAPVIRGLLGSHILIMVDGVRINDSTTRLGPNQSLNTIDPAIVDRVEILRGSGSVLYGSDAIGGVISIWTKRRRPETQDSEEYLRPYQGSADGLYNSAFEGTRVSMEMSWAEDEFGGLGVASGYDFEDFKAGDNETVRNTGYNGHGLFGSFEYALGKRRTLRFTARVNRDFNVPRTDKLNTGFGQTEPSHSDYRYSLQDRRGWLLSYTNEVPGPIADRLQLRFNLGTYEEQRDKMKTGSMDSTYERDAVTTIGFGADWQKAIGEEHLLTWGLDVSHDDVDSLRKVTTPTATTTVPGAFAPDSEYARFGAFLQDEIFSFDPWYFTVGARFSLFDYSFGDTGSYVSSSGNFSAVTASLEAARDVGDDVILTMGLAQGFRAPNLDDLANDGTFASGTELANPNLDPESSLTLEAGLELTKKVWRGAFSVFGTQIDDYIGRVLLSEGDPGQTGDEIYRRENSGELLLFGSELSSWHRVGGEDSAYSLDGTLAYVHGTQDDPSTGRVPARRIPPLHGQLGLSYEPEEREWFYIPNGRIFINWATSQDRLNPQDKSDPRIDPQGTSGWLTYNLAVWGDFNRDATWRIGLENLTDESYRVHGSGVDAAGTRVVFSVHLEF